MTTVNELQAKYTPEQLAQMDALGDWGSEEKSWDAASISIPEFTALIQEAYDLKQEVAALELQQKGVQEQLSKIQFKILDVMAKTNQTSFKTEFGQVVRNKRFSVKHPKDPDSRKAFFQYLQDKGVFENMVSVNSQTLTSWYNLEMQAAAEKGNVDFSVPGIEPPTYAEYLTMKKG